MTAPDTKSLMDLHDLYVKLSGMEIKFTSYHLYVWERWLHDGFTREDLELTCKYLNREIKAGNRKRPAVFKFIGFIQDTAKFADELAAARSDQRERQAHPNPAREQALREAGIAIPERETVRSAADILKQIKMTPEQLAEEHKKMAQQLAEFKKTLK